MNHFSRSVVVLFGGLLLMHSGCEPKADPDSYKKAVARIEDSLNALRAMGKVERKKFPVGEAFVVDLTNGQITDQTIDHLTQANPLAELHLHGATIADAQMQKFIESNLHTWLNVLDISDTAITDAGLAGLETAPFLGTLNVKGSKVSDDYLKKFADARKNNTNIRDMFKKVKITK